MTVEDLRAPAENSLATGPFGSSISSRFFQDHGVPVIRGSNLSEDVGTRLIDDGLVFLSDEKAAGFTRSTVREGDLVFTCWGTIDQVGLIDDRAKYREYVISNKQMKFSPDPLKADSLFLYYLFSSPSMRNEIRNQGIGSSVPGFNLGQLRSKRLMLPPLSEQRAIAHILGTLDDKIELNRRMSGTLEAMARALFKSWFVDFDPVRAKAEGRWKPGQSLPGLPAHLHDLFPDRLVDSELGEIPEGWEVKAVGDFCRLIRDGVNPSESPGEIFDHYSIPAYDDGRLPKPEAGFGIKSNKFAVPKGCVLLSKLNPRIPRVWLPLVSKSRRSVCSTEFLVAVPNPGCTAAFLYCLFTSQSFENEFASLVTGTSGSHQRVRPKAFLQLLTVAPPNPFLDVFERLVSDPLSRIADARNESRTLASLRDTVVPQLISGDLRVDPTQYQECVTGR